MAKKVLKLHNKSSKPDNVVENENSTIEKCAGIQKQLPGFMSDFFLFLKNAVSINTRLAYLRDIRFFCNYLVNETNLTEATEIKHVTIEDFDKLKARDINRYLGEYCSRYYVQSDNATYIMENHNPSLSRKKSSLSVLFKFLYRDEMIKNNIIDGFNPIKLPNPQPDAIKRLQIDEVEKMLYSVETGKGLTEKEQQYWEKTKYRDKAILVLFTTYGLRLSELQQLNVSSINFGRGEFKIYRKRSKEINMPINKSAEKVIKDYFEMERDSNEKITEVDKDALFISLQGKRMTVKSIRQLVKKYTSIAMGTTRENGYSPHKLRATAASSLIEYGFSIYDVQNLLDHDNVTTTQLYSAHRKNVKRDIVKNYELAEDKDEQKTP